MYRLILVAGIFIATAVRAEVAPDLGEELTAQRISATGFTVWPDGQGLPEGSGNAATGEKLYQTHCFACHGRNGENGINDRLAGGHGTIDSPKPVKTVGSYWPHATTLFDYIRSAMPYQRPGMLSDDEVYSVTAYILHLNGIVARDTDINATSLPQVQMPNRDNFVWAIQQTN
jgi:cytochrome c